MTIKNLENDEVAFIDRDGLVYLQFKLYEKYNEEIKHCFSTRLGGVSSNEYFSLNLGFNKNDKRDNVMENFRRICRALNINPEDLVFSNQVHDNKIRIVDENDRGKGITKISDIFGYDGLITNVKNVALVTFYADCVPIFFYENEKRVIALAHSGWRSTVKQIAKEMVEKMEKIYDCKTSNIKVAIGPSIGKCCFEVGEEVYMEFVNKIEWSAAFCNKVGKDKWYIDLPGIIKNTLIKFGVSNENISLSNTCTKCNKEIFFSHRGDNGKTGVLAAIIQLC